MKVFPPLQKDNYKPWQKLWHLFHRHPVTSLHSCHLTLLQDNHIQLSAHRLLKQHLLLLNKGYNRTLTRPDQICHIHLLYIRNRQYFLGYNRYYRRILYLAYTYFLPSRKTVSILFHKTPKISPEKTI